METLEFVIYPDGRVQEKVTGIQGSSCAEVTAALEQQLGVVIKHETTSEYYDRAPVQAVSESTYATRSEW